MMKGKANGKSGSMKSKRLKKSRPKTYWRQKLMDGKNLPVVKKIDGKMSKRWGTGTVAIPSPAEVNALMKEVPGGKLTTINQLRQKIAKKHRASIGCPICTGIFSWISANAAEEARLDGERNITPYWRTLKSDGAVNEKYPGGVPKQKKLLRDEGHRFANKGKKCIVLDYEKYLVDA